MTKSYNDLILDTAKDAFIHNPKMNKQDLELLINNTNDFINEKYAHILIPALNYKESLSYMLNEVPSLFWTTNLGLKTLRESFENESEKLLLNLNSNFISQFELRFNSDVVKHTINYESITNNVFTIMELITHNKFINNDLMILLAHDFSTHYGNKLLEIYDYLITNNMLDFNNDNDLNQVKKDLNKIEFVVRDKLSQSGYINDNYNNHPTHTIIFLLADSLAKGFEYFSNELNKKQKDVVGKILKLKTKSL